MTIKKSYKVGDNVWVYGITPKNIKPTKGKVIKIIDLSDAGYGPDVVHYVISIDTEIEPLLEIRTWDTMSQDEHGPVGSLRSLKNELSTTNRIINRLGYTNDDEDGPTPDEIMAALESSTKDLVHQPLVIKDSTQKPRRKYYPKKKKSS